MYQTVAVAKYIPMDVLSNHAAPKPNLTATETAERLSVPAAAGRLPCMQLHYNLIKFAPCHVNFERRRLPSVLVVPFFSVLVLLYELTSLGSLHLHVSGLQEVLFPRTTTR